MAAIVAKNEHVGLPPRTDWQSIYFLDETVTEQFFGQINAAQTFCMIMASLFAGWLSNQMSDTKPPIVIGTLFLCFGCLLYANLELDEQIDQRKWAFMGAQMLMGLGAGMMMTWRVHVAMSSLEKDRTKANSLVGFGIHIGFLLGPMFVLILGYILTTEDMYLPWGTKLNLYTAPAYLTALICLAISILIFFFFNGQMWKETLPINADQCGGRIPPPTNCEGNGLVDCLVITWPCFLTRICFTALVIYLSSISSPYSMAVFGWSGQQSVVYFMLIQGLSGILVNLGYALHLLAHLKERFCVLLSLAIFFSFFLLTYPWAFLSSKIPEPQYQNTTLANGTIIEQKVTYGCDPSQFSWCNDTPAINVCVYLAGLIIVHGLALPMAQLNLDVLYSRLLGSIKQGTMQGLFVAIGDLISLGGPIAITTVYQCSGPKPIWLAEMVIFSIAIAIWAICYRRLVPRGNEGRNKSTIVVGQAMIIAQAN